MAGNFTYPYTVTNGTTADADEVQGNFDTIKTNFTPLGLDDASADLAAMQTAADPNPADVASLPTSTEGELQRIRYILQQVLNNSDAAGAGYWYQFPDLKTKTAAYTAAVTDRVILCDGTAGAFTVTLPTAVGLTDKYFYIKKTDSSANAITIDGAGAETIDGNTTVFLANQYEYILIVSNGTNWQVLSDSSDIAAIKSFRRIVKWAKGTDVASAAALTLGDDGNYFDITGTTAITSIATKGIGTVVKLHFDGALTLTHHATDLILPGAVNITTAAGDEAEFVEYASGDWRCTNYQKANGRAVAGGKIVQVVNTQDGAVATGTTAIPYDDTIPQNTEGDEFMTLAITPASTSNKLKIEVTTHLSRSVGGDVTTALFQDSTADALAAAFTYISTADDVIIHTFTHYMAAGTTSSTTFKVRAGSSSGTTTFNGRSAARKFGGVLASSITITEIEA